MIGRVQQATPVPGKKKAQNPGGHLRVTLKRLQWACESKHRIHGSLPTFSEARETPVSSDRLKTRKLERKGDNVLKATREQVQPKPRPV